MPQDSPLDSLPTNGSAPYFRKPKAERYFVYHDIHHHATLDYDPVIAIARLEADIEQKDTLIASLMDKISDQESRAIDLIKEKQEAHEEAAKASTAFNVIEIINAELRVRMRELLKKIRKYGKSLT